MHAGDAVWIEDPGYPVTRPLLRAAGVRPVAVPVDEQGMDVAAGILTEPEARLAVVTPTHQSPLGVSLSLARRMALLDWRSSAGLILEDDYDSEFRYHGRPLPPLKSLDVQGRVLYAGTFSKTLFPALRMAYGGARRPDGGLARSSRLRGCGCPPLLQASVADFIRQGHFYRHLKRMRPLYRQRREWLTQALERQLGPADGGAAAGRHSAVGSAASRAGGCAVGGASVAAGAGGAGVVGLANRSSGGQGLLLGFANFSRREEAERAVQGLAQLFKHAN